MRMHKLLLICLSFLTIGSAQAQISSFYGKKCYIEMNAFGTYPLIAKRFQYDPFYWRTSSGSNSLTQHGDRFNYGYTGSITFLTKGQVSVGFAATLFYSNAPGLTEVSVTSTTGGYDYVYGVKGEAIDLRSLTFMPIINISSDKIIKPAGLNHEVGIGSTTTRIQDHLYALTTTQTGYYDQNDVYHSSGATGYLDSLNSDGNQFVNTNKTYKRVCFMYGIKMRSPISKNLMINYGFRYTLNVGQRDIQSSYNNSQIDYGIRKTQTFSLISFALGLTVLF